MPVNKKNPLFAAKFDSDFGLLTSRCQAQSTPSLIGALRWKPSSGNDAIGLASSSCNGSMGCGESDPSGGGEGRRESSSPERPSTSQKTVNVSSEIEQGKSEIFAKISAKYRWWRKGKKRTRSVVGKETFIGLTFGHPSPTSRTGLSNITGG